MPALMKTKHTGKIVWLGRVESRAAGLRSAPVSEVQVGFAGLEGEDHGGLTRPSCSRVTSQYAKGTQIRNTRQVCIVSAEEMAAVAAKIGVDSFNPEWCAANIVIEGIPDFTHIPPSSRLQTQDGTTLTVDMENRPCHLPAPVIDEDAPSHGRAFKAAAKGRRGVTAWVEREGPLRVGDTVTLHIPDQRAWSGDSD
ncbi:MOSC domain-containing protein [Litoreibacter janthinus]|uniref:MOSC domain-containing protein YiiM n=1 Tax=Litoreibacter janthinus TaxID=670154 RepID=A0A1I6HT94_9RHOB|nr:MOSC domain-containing protein [Litoreibacter janthinus]SFR57665.1 MOSC domain-containing protein YiiM [Litoreibacter janthinus]